MLYLFFIDLVKNLFYFCCQVGIVVFLYFVKMFLGCFGFIVVVGIFVNLDIFKDWVWEIRVFGRLDFFF